VERGWVEAQELWGLSPYCHLRLLSSLYTEPSGAYDKQDQSPQPCCFLPSACEVGTRVSPSLQRQKPRLRGQNSQGPALAPESSAFPWSWQLGLGRRWGLLQPRKSLRPNPSQKPPEQTRSCPLEPLEAQSTDYLKSHMEPGASGSHIWSWLLRRQRSGDHSSKPG
jgi:hypothetical protein